ncbi:MAG: GtrA family protein [Prevotella sp.]|nr:GtrA family protein [Prevotella sp.]
MELLKRLYAKFRHLILYGIIGSFTASLDFLVFTLLTRSLGVNYLVANCISVLVGITTSFYLNRTYNFKVSDKTAQRFSIFLAVGLTGLLMSNLILWVGIDKMHLNESITKLASIVLVVFFQFLFNKFITFRVKDNDTKPDNH